MGEVETVDDLALTVTPANELELSRAVAVDRGSDSGSSSDSAPKGKRSSREPSLLTKERQP